MKRVKLFICHSFNFFRSWNIAGTSLCFNNVTAAAFIEVCLFISDFLFLCPYPLCSFKGQRIILSGLNPEDKIITSGLQILPPGAPVQPITPPPATVDAAAKPAPTTASR